MLGCVDDEGSVDRMDGEGSVDRVDEERSIDRRDRRVQVHGQVGHQKRDIREAVSRSAMRGESTEGRVDSKGRHSVEGEAHDRTAPDVSKGGIEIRQRTYPASSKKLVTGAKVGKLARVVRVSVHMCWKTPRMAKRQEASTVVKIIVVCVRECKSARAGRYTFPKTEADRLTSDG